jgi:hypothetical protein
LNESNLGKFAPDHRGRVVLGGVVHDEYLGLEATERGENGLQAIAK